MKPPTHPGAKKVPIQREGMRSYDPADGLIRYIEIRLYPERPRPSLPYTVPMGSAFVVALYFITIAFALPTLLGRKSGKNMKRAVCLSVCLSVRVSHHALAAHPDLQAHQAQQLVWLETCTSISRDGRKSQISAAKSSRRRKTDTYGQTDGCMRPVLHTILLLAEPAPGFAWEFQ